jgi:hypothetical protein
MKDPLGLESFYRGDDPLEGDPCAPFGPEVVIDGGFSFSRDLFCYVAPIPAPPIPSEGPTPATCKINIKADGGLTRGNRLRFSSGDQTLGMKVIDLGNGRTTWSLQVELSGTVSDNVANWDIGQSYQGRKVSLFQLGRSPIRSDSPIAEPSDGPDSDFRQVVSGRKTLFWIDGPGYSTKDTIGTLVQLRQLQNFTSWIKQKNGPGYCEVKWHLYLVIRNGVLDREQTFWGLGHLQTNFEVDF